MYDRLKQGYLLHSQKRLAMIKLLEPSLVKKNQKLKPEKATEKDKIIWLRNKLDSSQ